MGKFWHGEFLANYTDKSYWQDKFGEYGKVNKYAKYFCHSVNIGKKNVGK